jgi:hypothetical protein
MNADQLTQTALDLMDRRGFAALNEQQKTLAAIWHFEAQVGNGGFSRFYASLEGEVAPYVPGAFRAIGALEMAEIAERANALFGPEGPPVDLDERMRAFHAFTDAGMEELQQLENRYLEFDEDDSALIEAYLERASADAGVH